LSPITSRVTVNTDNFTKNVCEIHLITGGTGAGKTTYARTLALETGAIRFSIDEWMSVLFWMDSPDPIRFDWVMTRINRVETQMWDTARHILSTGTPVIFDLGFTKQAHREKFRTLAASVNRPSILHWVDVDADERWNRVQGRNAEKGETFVMTVTPEMFKFMESEWETPETEPHKKIKT